MGSSRHHAVRHADSCEVHSLLLRRCIPSVVREPKSRRHRRRRTAVERPTSVYVIRCPIGRRSRDLLPLCEKGVS